MIPLAMRDLALDAGQGRQDSNLQPPVLEVWAAQPLRLKPAFPIS